MSFSDTYIIAFTVTPSQGCLFTNFLYGSVHISDAEVRNLEVYYYCTTYFIKFIFQGVCYNCEQLFLQGRQIRYVHVNKENVC